MFNQRTVKAFIADMFKNKSLVTTPKFPLYHYTDVNGLYGLISNNEFWVTKSNYLNDPSEITYFNTIYSELLNDNGILLMDNISTELIKKETNASLSFPDFCSRYHKYSNQFNETFQETFDLYILSFTSNSDSLTLWSNYSSHIGYNLGFNRTLLDCWNKENERFFLGRVIYSKSLQLRKIREHFLNAYLTFAYVYQSTEYTSHFTQSDLLNMIFGNLSMALKINSMFFKNYLFKSEEECRAVFVSNKDYEIPGKKHEVDFRPSNGVIIPYIKVPFKIKNISSINIGPKNNMDIAKNGLEFFLKNRNLEISDINKSKIKLRY
ncbi:MAG: hypothetical protein H6Q67_386 [Firmicutes bacterium]|nr:hypothetical protein [Bacillota bacterium]